MKLVLTIPALERLLSGDTEVEVELRKNIVHEFSKRHLSAVAKEVYGEIKKAKEIIRDEMLKEIGTARVQGFSGERYEISNELRLTIKNAIKEAMVAEVNASAQAAWDEIKSEILARLKTAYDAEVMKLMRHQAKLDVLKAMEDLGKAP